MTPAPTLAAQDERRGAPGGAPRSVPPLRRVRGRIRVPGDKSISHRAALFNAIAEGEARLEGFASGADCASTLRCIQALGAGVQQDGSRVIVQGVGMRGLREPSDVLDCGNSGTTMRLLSGLLSGQDIFAVLSGDGSLRGRPMARVVEPLGRMGARISGRDGGRLPPLVVQPAGRLAGGEQGLPIASAQVKSALLLAGLQADSETRIVEPAKTRDHSERLLAAMGADVRVDGTTVAVSPAERLRPASLSVPGDFSSAAFWLVLACLHPDAELTVEGVGLNPTRTGLLTILERMGAQVEVRNRREQAGEPVGDLVGCSGRLQATEVSGELVPLAIDEITLVALLGSFATGETVVRDATELRQKESDRLAAVAEGLNALGGKVQPTDDGWRIQPARLRGGRAASHGDHRIAMLLALAGALGEGVEIDDAEAVAISYPDFWSVLDRVGAG